MLRLIRQLDRRAGRALPPNRKDLVHQDTAIEKLEEKITRIASLRSQSRFCPQYKKWHRETEVLLQRIFGSASYQVSDFTNIGFVYRGMHVVGDPVPFENRYREALEEAEAILTSIKEEILEFGLAVDSPVSSNPILTLELLCSRFHTVARQLRVRHSQRPTLDVGDEYDVQDLLHALLRIYFRDVRSEEWTPSYAGNASRMDFLLKAEQIVVEVKMARKSLTDADLVDQLLVDTNRYESHPDCKLLVCFVYDPDGRIGNPTAIVADLESQAGQSAVRVFIFPQAD